MCPITENLNRVFISDQSGSADVDSAQEKLLHSFRSGTSACLVCIETIKKDEAVSLLYLNKGKRLQVDNTHICHRY